MPPLAIRPLCTLAVSTECPVFATSEVRLLQFGLGRDVCEPHCILSQLGVVREKAGPYPGRRRGKAGRYLKSVPPKLYRFELLNEGFEEPAMPITRQVMTRSR
jgi:hypothetical protein